MTISVSHVSAPRRTPPPAVRWRSWPIAEGGRPMGWLAALEAGMMAAVGTTTSSVGWSLAAGGLLAAAAWRALVPIAFEINSQGIAQEVFGRRHRISWRSVASCVVCRDGLWLSPTAGRRSFHAGLYLPWGVHRAEVLALVDYYLPRDDPVYGFEVK
ncbi:MAG TPA: hypothetical protein VGX76_23410 [Pirellulales bacterium]|nr:hypothetical protein [Pirellulales bacterium]